MSEATLVRGGLLRWCRMSALPGLLAMLVGCGEQAGPSADEHLARALEHREAGDFPATVIEFKNVLQSDPEHAEARWELGRTYMLLGIPSAAEVEFRKAEELGVAVDRTRPAIVRALLHQDSHAAALALLDEAGGAQDDAELLGLRAQALLGTGQPDAAEELLQRGRELQADQVDVLTGEALLAMGRGRFDAAVAAATRATEVNAGHWRHWALLGEAHLRSGAGVPAEAAFQRAVDLVPENPTAVVGLARSVIAQQRFEDAGPLLSRTLRLAPNNLNVFYFQAVVARARGDLVAAEAALRKIISAAPEHLPSVLLMGQVKYAQGEYRQAEDMLRKVVYAVPGNLPSRVLLGATYLRLGLPDEAATVLESAAELAPDSGRVLALLGHARLRAGNAADGQAVLERAASLIPDEPQISTELGVAQLAGGQVAEGLETLEGVIDVYDDFIRADVIRVYALLRREEYAAADLAAGVLMDKRPDSPVGAYLRGVAAEGMGESARAADLYRDALKLEPLYAEAAFALARTAMSDPQQQGEARAVLGAYLDQPSTAPRSRARATLALARLEREGGDAAAARARLEALVGSDASDPLAFVELAELSHTQGQTEQAVGYLRTAIEAFPGAVEPRLMLAGYYAGVGRLDDAVTLQREARELLANDDAISYGLARLLMATGTIREAVTILLDVAPRLWSTSPVVLDDLVHAASRTGELRGAEAVLQEIVSVAPDAIRPRVALTRVALAGADGETALRRARQMQSDFPDALIGLTLEADALLVSERPQEAADVLARVNRVDPSSTLAIKLSVAQRRAGDVDAAVQTLEAWLAQESEDVAARLAVASLYESSERMDDAVRSYRAVLEVDASNAPALNNLAMLLHARGEEEALELAERVHALYPGRVEHQDTLGWILVGHGSLPRGLDLLRQASRSAPDSAEVHYHLAVALARSGEVDGARRELRRIVATHPGTPFANEAQALLERL